jgi:hypothetical protein
MLLHQHRSLLLHHGSRLDVLCCSSRSSAAAAIAIAAGPGCAVGQLLGGIGAGGACCLPLGRSLLRLLLLLLRLLLLLLGGRQRGKASPAKPHPRGGAERRQAPKRRHEPRRELHHGLLLLLLLLRLRRQRQRSSALQIHSGWPILLQRGRRAEAARLLAAVCACSACRGRQLGLERGGGPAWALGLRRVSTLALLLLLAEKARINRSRRSALGQRPLCGV